MRTRSHVSIAILWAVIAVMLGYLTMILWSSYRSYENTTTERMLSLVRLVEQHATSKIDRANSALLEISDHLQPTDFSAGSHLTERRRLEINALLRKQQERTPGIVSITLADADGRAFANSVGGPIGTSIADRNYFLKLSSQPGTLPVVSEAVKGRLSNKWGIHIARRVDLVDGSFGGVMIANLGIVENFEHFYRSVNLADDSIISLRDPEHRVLVRYPVREDVLGKAPPSSGLALQVLSGQAEGVVMSKSPLDGIVRVTAVRKLPDYPVFAVVGLGRDASMRPWFRELFIAIYVAVAILAAGALLTRNMRLRNRHEAELLDTHDRLALAQRTAKAGFWDWDIETDRLTWSPELFALFGLDSKVTDANFETWRRVVHPDDLDQAEANIRDAIRDHRQLCNVYRIVLPTGSERWIEAIGEATYNLQGDAICMAGICYDITNRKQDEFKRVEAEQKLQHALHEVEGKERTKTRFLAAASHDLRQPVQAISLFSAALSKTSLDEQQKRISDYLSVSARNLSDILVALLDISRIESGTVKPCRGVMQVGGLLNNICTIFEPLAAGKSLRFRTYLPQNGIAIFADGKLLQSLLGNLIDNAIKYTERGGVLVSARHRGNQAVIQVWDTGIGIAEDHMDAIFDDYFQVGNPARDRTKGLGLGLSIVRRLAILMDTQVVCRSRLGKGSVFEIRIPLANKLQTEVPSDGEEVPSEDDTRTSLAERRLVVIDDNSSVAGAIKLSLEEHGLSVTTYCSAEEALASPTITNADFYISDFSLPGENGLQLLNAIRQRSGKPIKAMVLTGKVLSSDQIEMAQSFRWKVLLKPVNSHKLLSEIEALDSMP